MNGKLYYPNPFLVSVSFYESDLNTYIHFNFTYLALYTWRVTTHFISPLPQSAARSHHIIKVHAFRVPGWFSPPPATDYTYPTIIHKNLLIHEFSHSTYKNQLFLYLFFLLFTILIKLYRGSRTQIIFHQNQSVVVCCKFGYGHENYTMNLYVESVCRLTTIGLYFYIFLLTQIQTKVLNFFLFIKLFTIRTKL